MYCTRKVTDTVIWVGAVDRRLAEGTIAVRWPALILLIAATLVFGHYGAGYDATAFLYAQF